MATQGSILPVQNILITIPRTASNLVTRLLNLPAQISILRHPQDGYFFIPALGYRLEHDTFRRDIGEWTDEEREGMTEALQVSFNAWEGWIKQASHVGKETFIKEHVNWMVRPEEQSWFLHNGDVPRREKPRNPTIAPDKFLLHDTRPTFLIRHLALTFPSLLRTALDNEGPDEVRTKSAEKMMQWECTYHHMLLYTFLMASPCYPRAS